MRDTTADGTKRTAYEHSPSTGWRELAARMHVPAGLEECDVRDCDHAGDPVRVVDDADTDAVREGVRCSDHAKDFLEVSS